MRWYVLQKSTGYKILYAARPPVAEGPVVASYETYAEASLAIKSLADFNAGASSGNA